MAHRIFIALFYFCLLLSCKSDAQSWMQGSIKGWERISGSGDVSKIR